MMKNYYWFRSHYNGEIVSASSLEAIKELAIEEQSLFPVATDIYHGEDYVTTLSVCQ